MFVFNSRKTSKITVCLLLIMIFTVVYSPCALAAQYTGLVSLSFLEDEIAVDVSPSITAKTAPPASDTDYVDTWQSKTIQDKLLTIPYWVYGVAGFGLLLIFIIKISRIRKK